MSSSSLWMRVDPQQRIPFSLIIFLFRKPGDWGWQYLNTIFTERRGGPTFRSTIQVPRGLFIHTVKLGPDPPKPYSLSRAAFGPCYNPYALVTVFGLMCVLLRVTYCVSGNV